jgi:hypothetical protein
MAASAARIATTTEIMNTIVVGALSRMFILNPPADDSTDDLYSKPTALTPGIRTRRQIALRQ